MKGKIKEKTKKINFIKKIYFSICKINEYGNMSKEGVRRSIIYITNLIMICSLLYSAILVFQMMKNANGLQEYLEENFPNITYEENKLISENEERTILNHDLVKVNFGGELVIDTKTDYNKLIEEYKTKGEPTILLTSEKYVTINSQGTVLEYDYSSIINNVDGEQVVIDKEYWVSLFSNISYEFYFFGYFIGCVIGISILIHLFNLITAIITFVFCKIKKINIKFKQIYSMGLYGYTTFVFGYFILYIWSVAFIQLLILLLPVIYLFCAIYKYNSRVVQNS